MNLKRVVKGLIRRIGPAVSRSGPFMDAALLRRARLLAHYHINVVLDVGANSGQYGLQLRQAEYRGRIVSFEPLTTAYSELLQTVRGDAAWTTSNIALGDENRDDEINVAANSHSSSLLEMLPAHQKAAPDSCYVRTQPITVRRLDGELERWVNPDDNVFMKVDTQGYERRVIAGAGSRLRRIRGLQLEMSLVELYKGELLFYDMCQLMTAKGYALMSLEPGFSDPKSGRLLQVDGVFFQIESALANA